MARKEPTSSIQPRKSKVWKVLKWCIIIVLICAVFLVVDLLAVAGGFWCYFTAMEKPPGPPQVISGEHFLTKSVFFEDSRVGNVTDIGRGQFDGKPGTDMGYAGADGANIGTDAGFTFPDRHNSITIVDVENDGVCEFMNRGGYGYAPALMDHTSKMIWSYSDRGDGNNLGGMVSGDVNNDGKLEFASVGSYGHTIRLLDSRGRELWHRDDRRGDTVEIADANSDGKLEVMHIGREAITLLDAQGKVLSSGPGPAEYSSELSLCSWLDKKHLLVTGKQALYLLDLRGRMVSKFEAPKCNNLWYAYGVAVNLKQGQPKYLAVVAGPEPGEGSVLYVYDAKGLLVYQEILPSGSCVAAVPGSAPGTEQFLVGGGSGIVWSYTAK